ncbi:MAG: DinB family protein [Chitinophagales bacterium]|nr:DinB family protein [Bacteroidota bacterium]MCB9256199.1 DinB family protein [Chitinophagales bacterium]
MEASFEIHASTRALLLKSVQDLSLDQVNYMPKNFKNTIAWNCAHIVVTQQILSYKLSSNKLLVEASFVEKFKKGTVVEQAVEQEEWLEICQLLASTHLELKKDYEAKLFKQFEEYPTSYGYVLRNIEEAIQFNNVHEALHLGYIMSMKKSLI